MEIIEIIFNIVVFQLVLHVMEELNKTVLRVMILYIILIHSVIYLAQVLDHFLIKRIIFVLLAI